MNYQHAYHAGSFSDVFKHILLMSLLNSLSRKETPYCYIDTHAGAGCYDLFAPASVKSKEYVQGIEKVIQANNPPLIVKRYLEYVHRLNNKLSHAHYASLRYYPGSPIIARDCARPHDRIIACELQLPVYQALKSTFMGDKQVALHHMDGFLGLKAFLPPTPRRGLILIDPPYEDPDEFTHIAQALLPALKRFETGVYAIWYPIKEQAQTARFYRILAQHVHQPMVAVTLTIYPDLANHLNGCGVVVINPPWQWEASLDEWLPWLWNVLSINHQGQYTVHTLPVR